MGFLDSIKKRLGGGAEPLQRGSQTPRFDGTMSRFIKNNKIESGATNVDLHDRAEKVEALQRWIEAVLHADPVAARSTLRDCPATARGPKLAHDGVQR